MIDDTPPEVTFLGAPNHPLGIVVGPASPLVFQVEDLLSNTGVGTLVLDPANPIEIESNQLFSMSETTLRAQFEAANIAGNVSLFTLRIEFKEELFDQDPLELLSPRLGPDACWDENNVPQTCSQGSIDAVATSCHGDVYLFASSGERFIAGDTNSASDIFMNRDGVLTRVSVAADGTEANGASTRPAVSGDGRFAYFMSTATNRVPGTSGANFYVKDLSTGQIAVITRRTDGSPANMPGNLSLSPLAPTRNGRFVYFESRSTLHLSGVSDTNIDVDIFMVDLDPENNGLYFDDNYVTVGISKPSAASMANAFSTKPSVTLDGQFLVFRTQATNLHPDLADNGSAADALLMRFSGSADDGTLDVSTPELVPVNREAFFNGTSVTATGIEDVKIAPLTEDIVFTTRSNITGTSDSKSQSLGKGVYFSFKTGNPQSRFISWVSKDTNFGNSSETITQSFETLTVSTHGPITAFEAFKLGWVSQHNDIVPGDSNGVTDLFRAINDSPTTTGLAAANWITSGQPSAATTLHGGFVGDGRWAWWATTQAYTTPYSPSGFANLYRRRIDPAVTTTLTFSVAGGGTILRDMPGTATANPDAFEYSDEGRVILDAVPDVGFEFVGWQGIDRELSGTTALVRPHSDRSVVATFAATPAPSAASATMTTLEDVPSAGVAPIITGDPSQSYAITLASQPMNGTATVQAGLLYYAPDADFFGSDRFTFQVTNSFGQSLPIPGTALVTVTAVNDPRRRRRVCLYR